MYDNVSPYGLMDVTEGGHKGAIAPAALHALRLHQDALQGVHNRLGVERNNDSASTGP